MRRFMCIAALALLTSAAALAVSQDLCSGNAKLQDLQGVWADARLVDAIRTTRSWTAALNRVDPQSASVLIRGSAAYRNLAWHEGDTGDQNCVRAEGRKLRLLPMAGRGDDRGSGPLLRIADRHEDEGRFYLSQMFSGCYASDHGETWCLDGRGIRIDARRIDAALQLDLSEGPLYGTPIRVQGFALPFLVFVPRGDGWAVFQDDYASVEGRAPIDPERSTPWRVLHHAPGARMPR